MERELVFIENSLKDGNLAAGLETLQRLLSKYKANQTSLQIILERLYALGQQFIKEKSFRAIFPLFQILSKLCSILNDSSRLCDIKNSLSFCYRNTGQINLALKECLEALEIAGELKPLITKLSALHINACAIYREDVKDLNIAKTHAELAYFFAKENCNLNSEKDKRTLAVACYNYGVVLEEMKDKANALVWYKEGLKFCEEKWDDLYMEQVFREKIAGLTMDGKKGMGNKKRTASQRPSGLKKYHFAKEIGKSLQRPKTNKNRSVRSSQKYSLTPISGKTLPINSVNLERNTFYQELESEYRVKTRNTNTPSASVKNQRIHTETYKSPPKMKMSLVQCVIKIQKWYRRVFRKQGFFLKFHYLTLGIKVFFGVKYFVCGYEVNNTSEFVVEAWPLARRIKKPKDLKLTFSELNKILGSPEDTQLTSKIHSKLLNNLIQINNSVLTVDTLNSLFKGIHTISNKEYLVTIWYHSRTLEIETSSESETLSCTVKLDPLQDLSNLKSKIEIILANLEVKSGELLFNLN